MFCREPADNDFSNENDSQERMQIVYAIIVGVILVIALIIIIIVVCWCKKRFCFSDSHIRRENLI